MSRRVVRWRVSLCAGAALSVACTAFRFTRQIDLIPTDGTPAIILTLSGSNLEQSGPAEARLADGSVASGSWEIVGTPVVTMVPYTTRDGRQAPIGVANNGQPTGKITLS